MAPPATGLPRRLPALECHRHSATLQTVRDPHRPGPVGTGEADRDRGTGAGLRIGRSVGRGLGAVLGPVRDIRWLCRLRPRRHGRPGGRGRARRRRRTKVGQPLQERTQLPGRPARPRGMGGRRPVLLPFARPTGRPSNVRARLGRQPRQTSDDRSGRLGLRRRFPDVAGQFGLADRHAPLVGDGQPQHGGTGDLTCRDDEPRRAVRTAEPVQYDAGVVEHFTDEVRSTVQRDTEGQFLLVVGPCLAVVLAAGVEGAAQVDADVVDQSRLHLAQPAHDRFDQQRLFVTAHGEAPSRSRAPCSWGPVRCSVLRGGRSTGTSGCRAVAERGAVLARRRCRRP